jgi:maltooligosyltrehalose trehalohydrolase
MHEFTVWAPNANKVAVKIGEKMYPMSGPGERGWWRVAVEQAGPGTDYGFAIDDDAKAWPDPRSQWQPRGVHGLSRIYDQTVFAWNDDGWQAPPFSRAVIYELHVGTFTSAGTFDSAIERLDYLLELGITHVELMPVAAFPGGHGWGYDGAALFAVYEGYGGPDGLKRLVNACHSRGLAVLLDVVYNHFGPVGNYTGKFAPYLNDAHRTPWGGAVNLEEEWSHQVRRFFCDNALMWLRDYHMDGLRLDAVHAFVDRSAIHFLEQLSAEVGALSATLGRALVVIAESDLNDPRVVARRESGGMGMDAQWSDDFHHALFAVLCGGKVDGYYADFGAMGQLAKALEQSFVYDGIYSRFRNRVHGKTARQLEQHRFLGYIQNHDQVGNRAVGDRLGEIVGFHRAKVAAAVVLLSPFIPMIFQGEEWAASSPFQYFADHEDPEMARLVREGRKREFAPFGWALESIPNPEARETFERSKLKWDETDHGEHAEMLEWYRELIRLRRRTPSLNAAEPGQTSVSYDEQGKTVSMVRGSVALYCNLGEREWSFGLPSDGKVILSSRGVVALQEGDLALEPDTAVVIATAAVEPEA